MSCEICSLETTVDTVLWSCIGCARPFHAACVGVPVQRGSLRKRDKKIDVQSYVLPCCSSCQVLVTLEFDLRSLTEQQKAFKSQLDNNTQVLHRLASQKDKSDSIVDAVSGLESSLSTIMESVSTVNNKTSSKVENAVSTFSRGVEVKSDEVVGIKNHLTSLFNISMEKTRNRIEDYVRDLTVDLSRELTNICDEVKNLSSLTMDMAAQCNERSTPNVLTGDAVGAEILNKIKCLESAITTMDARLPSPPSLLDELNNTDNKNNKDADDSGWRVLGDRKVWKADWTEYDARKSRRLSQQKLAEKARKRRKQNRAQQKSFNIHNNNNSHNRSRNNNNNRNNNNRNNNDDYNCNSNHANYNSDITTNSHIHRNTKHINHRDSNNNNNNMNSNNNNNNNSNNHDINHYSNYSRNNFLPSDRELLAAAKDQFSRPSTNFRPTIQFQRGEVLNPYPVGNGIQRNSSGCSSVTSCEACYCRRSCFLRN